MSAEPLNLAAIRAEHEYHRGATGNGECVYTGRHQTSRHCLLYRLAEALERVREAVSRHPEPCTDTPFSCGWKSAVLDIRHALKGNE